MAMNFISPFIGPLMTPLMNHIKYLLKARTSVDDMAEQLGTLRALRRDLHKIIEDAERDGKRSTDEVNSWLESVDEVENEVVKIRNEYEKRCCLFGDFSINCCLVYKCSRSASKVYEKMVRLATRKGTISSITTKPSPGHDGALPIESTLVGLDLYVERIRNHLTDDAVRIIGIHGMGGVGKTTLLKTVHNALSKGDRLGTEHIIWVVVSKEFQLEKIQAEVAKGLGLTLNDKDDASGHARNIYNYLKDRSFLLLLDDVWQYINLVHEVGIPDPCSGTSSDNRTKRIQKVILTTRLNDVCGKMGAEEIVKVEPLNTEDAKALFKKTLGERNFQSNPAIHGLVEEVISECAGLPLALTVIARAMASKTSISQWQRSVDYLKRSQANKILNDENLNMLPKLKFSYDSLENDDLRRCFLYCSLWPEDSVIWIRELISFCIANEVIKEYDSMSEAYDKGHCLIEDLKGACLLEDGGSGLDSGVKMHDVLRDLALWIASDCGKNQNKWVVKSGIGLREAPLEAEKWKEAQVVSLMRNDIEELPSLAFECPTLSILLLRFNYYLKKIHPRFFQNMCALTYLDLSHTHISELPESITMLARLRCLNLESTLWLQHIPPGMISSLKELQILNLFGSSICEYLDGVGAAEENDDGVEFKDDGEEDGEDIEEVSGSGSKCRDMSRREKSLLEELECLPRGLKGLTITVFSADALRRLTTLSRASVWKLYLVRLEESTILLEHKILSSLQELWVADDGNVEVLEFDGESCPVEDLWIVGLPKLKEILWRGVAPSVTILHRLHQVYLRRCDSLKSISWILRLPSLVVLDVWFCKGLECLVEEEDENRTTVAFPTLKHLELDHLPNLHCICCGPQYGLPSLESLKVNECPMLKKFPFLSNNNSIDKLGGIWCDDSWWDGLEWDDETIKASLESIRTRF